MEGSFDEIEYEPNMADHNGIIACSVPNGHGYRIRDCDFERDLKFAIRNSALYKFILETRFFEKHPKKAPAEDEEFRKIESLLNVYEGWESLHCGCSDSLSDVENHKTSSPSGKN